jgi:hypothetical protein
MSISGGYSLRNTVQKSCTSKAATTVADAISRLDNVKTNWMMFTKCWCHYTKQASPEESKTTQQHQLNMVFANRSKEDVIYPLTVKEIALAQVRDLVLKKLTKMEKYSTHLVEDTEVLCKDGKVVIPKFFSVE